MKTYKVIWFTFFMLSVIPLKGQDPLRSWTLSDCIHQALQNNISIKQKELNSKAKRISLEQTRAERFPSVSALVNQNFAWSKSLDSLGNSDVFSGSDNTSFGINSSLRLFNGFKTENVIKQSVLLLEASDYQVETIRESVSLSVMENYLQLLYSKEQVENSLKQIESTSQQLKLAEERFALGAISKSEYLLVKSELATEKLTLAKAQSLMSMNRIALMQLMELPANDSFDIEDPEIDENLVAGSTYNVDSVYKLALSLRPQIKASEINYSVAGIDVSIAKASLFPSLTMSGGISTDYSTRYSDGFGNQFHNNLNPNLGLTMSVPLYQNKQAKLAIETAKIGVFNAELEMIDIQNQLRKQIEQACNDAMTANNTYLASLEQYNANYESYLVAEEKFYLGLLNSIDFLIQKNNLIKAESELLQSKYSLIFKNKMVDFYQVKNIF